MLEINRFKHLSITTWAYTKLQNTECAPKMYVDANI